MTPFQNALLLLLRYDAPVDAPLPVLSPGDWDGVRTEAGRHGLKPLLYDRIRNRPRAIESPDLPDSALADLRRAYHLASAANMRRFHFLGAALQSLAGAGIPTIVLKGAYLAEAVYGNLSLRTMSDADILVRRSDLAPADAALRSAGFEPREFSLDPPPDLNEFHYVHRTANALLELHWEIFNSEYPFAFGSETLWPAAAPVRVAGTDALALSPEDLLCHLCVHAVIHSFSHGLKTLCDVAESVARLPLRWDRLIERARDFRAERPVWMVLTLARRLLGAAVSDDLLAPPPRGLCPAEVSAGFSETLFRFACEAILPDRPEGGVRAPLGNPNLVLMFGRKGIRPKLSMVLRRVFPSRETISSLYPVRTGSPRIVFYYLCWIRSVVKRNAPAAWAQLSPFRRRTSSADSSRNAAVLQDWLIRE